MTVKHGGYVGDDEKRLQHLLVLIAELKSNFNLKEHLGRQIAFSEKTFGPGNRTKGVVDHIRKELNEIEAEPLDLEEWVDVIILAFDGAWRSGATAQEIIDKLIYKQTKNESRNWPDWRTADTDKAITHVKEK